MLRWLEKILKWSKVTGEVTESSQPENNVRELIKTLATCVFVVKWL